MSLTPYPTLRLKLTGPQTLNVKVAVPQALKLQFIPVLPGGAATAAALANKVDRAGDSMSGFLTLNADPLAPLQAATKQYVDAHVSPSGGGRPLLTGNVNYFVAPSPTGNDSTGNGSAGSPWANAQTAINKLNTLDGGGFAATVSVANGNYTQPVVAATPFIGFSSVTLQGDVVSSGTPLVAINTTNANCITVDNGTILTVKGFKLSAGGTNVGFRYGIWTQNQAVINVTDNMEFAACIDGYMFAFTNSTINIPTTRLRFSGNAVFALAAASATITNTASNIAVTIVGSISIGTFAYADRQGLINLWRNDGLNPFSGAAGVTGKNFDVRANGVIFTNGGGGSVTTFFPGTVAGTFPPLTGGQLL
jgi:hypothetical protein